MLINQAKNWGLCQKYKKPLIIFYTEIFESIRYRVSALSIFWYQLRFFCNSEFTRVYVTCHSLRDTCLIRSSWSVLLWCYGPLQYNLSRRSFILFIIRVVSAPVHSLRGNTQCVCLSLVSLNIQAQHHRIENSVLAHGLLCTHTETSISVNVQMLNWVLFCVFLHFNR